MWEAKRISWNPGWSSACCACCTADRRRGRSSPEIVLCTCIPDLAACSQPPARLRRRLARPSGPDRELEPRGGRGGKVSGVRAHSTVAKGTGSYRLLHGAAKVQGTAVFKPPAGSRAVQARAAAFNPRRSGEEEVST